MANILAFAETRAGELRKTALEAVTAARQLADATGGGEVHAIVFGPAGTAAKAAVVPRTIALAARRAMPRLRKLLHVCVMRVVSIRSQGVR